MSERVDQEIRTAVTELVDTGPPPHPAEQVLGSPARRPSPLPLRSGMARMGAVALIVLLVGLAGAWIGRNLVPAEVADSPDVSIVEGVLGPEPGFDPTVYGAEAAMLPGGELQPEIPEEPSVAPSGDVVSVGRIPGTPLEVFTWVNTQGETCIQIVGENSRMTCMAESEDWVSDPGDIPPGTDFADPPGFFWMRYPEESPEPTHVVVATAVPEGTSVVAFGASGELMWQRPKGGVWAYAVSPDTPRLIVSTWDADQNHLASTMFLPREATDPVERGETELQGSPEDLVELDESHPVAEILAEGATTAEELGEEADERGMSGRGCNTGTMGGLPPTYRFCLMVLDRTLILVPFEGAPGLTARISDPGLAEDVVIPLDRTEPIGIRNLEGPGLDVRIEYLGEETGGLQHNSLFENS